MNYFILNQSCSTYWCANENGYTSVIANAGIYSEEDKIRMEKFHTEDRCKFILIDRDILDKARKQLDNIDKNLDKRSIQIKYNYERDFEELQDDRCKNNNLYSKLYNIEKEFEL